MFTLLVCYFALVRSVTRTLLSVCAGCTLLVAGFDPGTSAQLYGVSAQISCKHNTTCLNTALLCNAPRLHCMGLVSGTQEGAPFGCLPGLLYALVCCVSCRTPHIVVQLVRAGIYSACITTTSRCSRHFLPVCLGLLACVARGGRHGMLHLHARAQHTHYAFLRKLQHLLLGDRLWDHTQGCFLRLCGLVGQVGSAVILDGVAA